MKDPIQATKIQAAARGFFECKKKIIPTLLEACKKEVKEKSSSIMSQLAEKSQYDVIGRLANAIKQEHWHEAMQIIRGIPEREMKLPIPVNDKNNNNAQIVTKTIIFKY